MAMTEPTQAPIVLIEPTPVLRREFAAMTEPTQAIFGYFSRPDQTVPDFDPGTKILCPICLRPLPNGPIKTISLMRPGDGRSFFYRLHKDCAENSEAVQQVESTLIDAVKP